MVISAAQHPTGDVRPELARLIERHARGVGLHETGWPGLEVIREERPRARAPVILEPCLCVVAQGRKRAYLGSDAFTYDALHYLVVAVPLPVETEIVEATASRPYLALRLRFDTSALSELLLAMDDADDARKSRPPIGIYTSRLDDALADALLRLIKALDDPVDRRMLAPMAEREVLYHLLQGEQGAQLRAVALRDGQSHRIAQVLRLLQTTFDQPFDIATIAEAAGMSTSTLHHAFKSVTGSSPLQYLKQVRLHQARLLMLHDGLGASEAARRVGYGSGSQFSREYRRFFGVPPSLDLATRHTETGLATKS